MNQASKGMGSLRLPVSGKQGAIPRSLGQKREQGLLGILIPFFDGELVHGGEGPPNLTCLFASREKMVENPKKYPMIV